MQAFNEENANLFVILFIKGLLVRTNVRNNRSSLWQDKNVSSKGTPQGEVVEVTTFYGILHSYRSKLIKNISKVISKNSLLRPSG